MSVAAPFILAAAGLSAFSNLQQGKAQEQAAINNANAITADSRAESNAVMQRAEVLKGQQVAKAASNGLLISGSITDIILDDAQKSVVEAENIRIRGDNQAAVERFKGKQAKKQSRINAVSDILGAGVSIASGIN